MKRGAKSVPKATARPAALFAAALVFLGTPAFAGGGAQGAPQGAPQSGRNSLSVLVYITGMLAGSPPYELMAAGAESFAAAHKEVTVKVYEAGFTRPNERNS